MRRFNFITTIVFLFITTNLYAQPENLHVTSGKINKRNAVLYIDDSVRVQTKNAKQKSATIQFKYLGESSITKALASGEIRRQIGLKLKAQNTCNLIYIMWHIQPKSKLGIALKINQNMNTHAQCGAKGYTNLKPEYIKDIPKIQKNVWHSLNAQIVNDYLLVYADNQLVWKGRLPKKALDLQDDIGFRTDNGKFEVIFSSDKPCADAFLSALISANPQVVHSSNYAINEIIKSNNFDKDRVKAQLENSQNTENNQKPTLPTYEEATKGLVDSQ